MIPATLIHCQACGYVIDEEDARRHWFTEELVCFDCHWDLCEEHGPEDEESEE